MFFALILLKYSNGVRNKDKTQKIIYMKEKNRTVKDRNKAAKEKGNRVLANCCDVGVCGMSALVVTNVL